MTSGENSLPAGLVLSKSLRHSTLVCNHCMDAYEVMCFSDAPYYPTIQYVCPDPGNNNLSDSSQDDYYNTNPSDAVTWRPIFAIRPQVDPC